MMKLFRRSLPSLLLFTSIISHYPLEWVRADNTIDHENVDTTTIAHDKSESNLQGLKRLKQNSNNEHEEGMAGDEYVSVENANLKVKTEEDGANIGFESKREHRNLREHVKSNHILSYKYHEVTWLTAHNSYAEVGRTTAAASNQNKNMYEQLNDYGVRGLMIDIRYEDGRMELTHGDDNAGEFIDRMEKEVIRYLNEDKNAIITFDIEVNYGDVGKEETRLYLKEALDKLPDLKRRIFNIENWSDYDEWPTLKEMIDADQRVLMIIDEVKLAGDYDDNVHILYRPWVTVENMWAVVDKDSCEERHGFGKDTINYLGFKWSRLFTMNHFRTWGHFGAQSSRDNNWDHLYRHTEHCRGKNGIGRKPNYLAVDFIEKGDGEEIAEFYSDGGIIFYEGNAATQDIVCGLSGKIARTFNSRNLGCENDEARSAKIYNTAKGTAFAVYDSFGQKMSDDFAVFSIKKDIGEKGHVISSFEKTYSDAYIDMRYYRNNGLDGKVSSFSIQPNGISSIVGKGLILFYEGGNASQNLVCTLVARSESVNFKKDPYGCDNDEARSLILSGVAKGTLIRIYDSPDGDHGDDWINIYVKKQTGLNYVVKSFEESYEDSFVKAEMKWKNGLNGKVSRVRIWEGTLT